jgi:hypothetical protein
VRAGKHVVPDAIELEGFALHVNRRIALANLCCLVEDTLRRRNGDALPVLAVEGQFDVLNIGQVRLNPCMAPTQFPTELAVIRDALGSEFGQRRPAPGRSADTPTPLPPGNTPARHLR